MNNYYWSFLDSRYFTTRSSLDGKETEVIQTPSGPGRWNTDSIAVASCLDPQLADRIAKLLAQHGSKDK